MRLKYSIFQTILEIAAFISLLALWIYIFTSWDSLPDKIPAHYNVAGAVDRWGNKNGILLLPILGAALYILISIVSIFPTLWNIPIKITEENKEFVYQNMKSLIIIMKFEIIICFAYITYCDINMQSLGIWFLPFFLIAIFGTIAYFTVKVRRA